jgi:hypothetical protein
MVFMKKTCCVLSASLLVAGAVLLFSTAAHADLIMTNGDQDGFVNDGQYNRNGSFIVIGEEGFAGIFEFHLKSKHKVRRAILVINVKKVKKKGEFALYHQVSFNNGEAEVQDYYATNDLVSQKTIENDGPVEFDVTQYVNEDVTGPGEYTSYKLAAEGDGQIVVYSFEGGQENAARILIER